MILSSLSLIGAAAVYAPNGPSPLIWGIMETPSREYTLALIIIVGVVLVIFGYALLLRKGGKKQSVETLINEEALLLSKFLRNEKMEWNPRIGLCAR